MTRIKDRLSSRNFLRLGLYRAVKNIRDPEISNKRKGRGSQM